MDLAQIMERLNELDRRIEEHRSNVQTEFERIASILGAHEEQIERTASVFAARNKSAATIRNMTDADAVKVLTGDLKDLQHKEAAEQGGLTYAQVYSCRLEYTFKQVHKKLRAEGFMNPWAKKS